MSDYPKPKLTPFGQGILRAKQELLKHGRDAIGNGWTPDQHPTICCPTDTPKPVRKRTPEQRRAWFLERATNADGLALRHKNIAARVRKEIEASRSADFGEINIPMKYRIKDLDRAITRAGQLENAIRGAKHHEARAEYWRQKAEEA